ncbi:hypothetical protein TNCV_2452651 [Trichonephila clavipes]|nr:hypothetical protein TNCV_2452651 [Trichonephila clavipes]
MENILVKGRASHLSSSSSNLTRGLAAQRLFNVPPHRKDTIHLQTSVPSLGFEPKPYAQQSASLTNIYRLETPTLVHRWIPRGVSFQRPRHRLIAVASLGRLSRNRSIRVWFTRYPRTALSDRWRSLGITSLMNIGGIRYVHIHSYIGHHDQACVLAYRWIPRGVSFQRPRHRLIAVASLGRLSRNRSIRVWFTRYPRTALSDRWALSWHYVINEYRRDTICAHPFLHRPS